LLTKGGLGPQLSWSFLATVSGPSPRAVDHSCSNASLTLGPSDFHDGPVALDLPGSVVVTMQVLAERGLGYVIRKRCHRLSHFFLCIGKYA
jgi:hypothetical protein